jgi:hypothetical protein
LNPPAVVHEVMVPRTYQDHVLVDGRTAIGPVPDVVSVAAAGRHVAADERAALVAGFEPTAHRRARQPLP